MGFAVLEIYGNMRVISTFLRIYFSYVYSFTGFCRLICFFILFSIEYRILFVFSIDFFIYFSQFSETFWPVYVLFIWLMIMRTFSYWNDNCECFENYFKNCQVCFFGWCFQSKRDSNSIKNHDGLKFTENIFHNVE